MTNPNPKTSLEEVRARRLEREKQEAQAQVVPPIDVQPSDETVAESKPIIPSFEDILTRMSPDQLETVRKLAISKGLAPTTSGGTKLPDGSVRCEITVAPEYVTQIEEWASADGIDLVSEIQKMATMALESYICGDWTVYPEQQVAPVATSTGATK